MENISMSVKEVSRIDWLSQVKRGEMSLCLAAEKMSLSYRQTKRIWKRYSASGASGLVHGLRGKPSNRKTDESLRKRVLALYEEKYFDFGCTLAVEYLQAEDKISIPVETLRYWLKKAGKYQRRRKSRTHRAWRPRRERSGELVQMDGSPHAWFGDRGPKAVLMEMWMMLRVERCVASTRRRRPRQRWTCSSLREEVRFASRVVCGSRQHLRNQP